ncbi:DUF6183 family protein [Nannocystis pusilla]|uniref:DUF6183 family protein n=1 Tax=Nannocystis pusilla TaxID=889268 RepID=UPI003B817077
MSRTAEAETLARLVGDSQAWASWLARLNRAVADGELELLEALVELLARQRPTHLDVALQALVLVPGDAAAVRAVEALRRATRVDVRPLSAEQVFTLLLAFAANGGDYNIGISGAYSRLHAWRSLGGLVDAPADPPLEAIEAEARAIERIGGFAHFASDSRWFNHVVTDLGLAAVRADGRSLAVLAGTDTD